MSVFFNKHNGKIPEGKPYDVNKHSHISKPCLLKLDIKRHSPNILYISASLAMSTSVLKALPGKLDIKRHSPSILYLSSTIKQILTSIYTVKIQCDLEEFLFRVWDAIALFVSP